MGGVLIYQKIQHKNQFDVTNNFINSQQILLEDVLEAINNMPREIQKSTEASQKLFESNQAELNAINTRIVQIDGNQQASEQRISRKLIENIVKIKNEILEEMSETQISWEQLQDIKQQIINELRQEIIEETKNEILEEIKIELQTKEPINASNSTQPATPKRGFGFGQWYNADIEDAISKQDETKRKRELEIENERKYVKSRRLGFDKNMVFISASLSTYQCWQIAVLVESLRDLGFNNIFLITHMYTPNNAAFFFKDSEALNSQKELVTQLLHKNDQQIVLLDQLSALNISMFITRDYRNHLGDDYTPYNRIGGLIDFYEYLKLSPEAKKYFNQFESFILLDPDMIVMKPIDYVAEKGHPLAYKSNIVGLNSHTKMINTLVTYTSYVADAFTPLIIHPTDLELVCSELSGTYLFFYLFFLFVKRYYPSGCILRRY